MGEKIKTSAKATLRKTRVDVKLNVLVGAEVLCLEIA